MVALTRIAFFVLPAMIQVTEDVTEEERGQENDKLDENDTREQRTAEVGGQLSCCPKL